MIEMEGVTKKYGNLTALQDVSLQIRKNERFTWNDIIFRMSTLILLTLRNSLLNVKR